MSTTSCSPVAPLRSPMEPRRSIGAAQTRSCAWAKRMSPIWSLCVWITADRQNELQVRNGESVVLIADTTTERSRSNSYRLRAGCHAGLVLPSIDENLYRNCRSASCDRRKCSLLAWHRYEERSVG